MAWCLTKDQEAKFRNALTSKKLDPFKLADMTSEQRRAEFEKYVDGENAQNINSLFESKLLLKNQVTGFKNWAKRALNMTPVAKRDLLSKIERLDDLGVLDPKEMQDFMQDLATSRLGFGITFEEAKIINQLSEERVAAKESWEEELSGHEDWKDDPHGTRKKWIRNPKRLEYGMKQVALENYVNDLKLKARRKRVSIKEDPIRALVNPIKESPVFFNDLFKSLMASIDNSFYGRQGIKNLYGKPAQKRIWARNFIRSFADMAAELRRNKNAFSPMDFIKADIYSRPNSVNGKYKAGNYQLDVLTEEVFPTSIPEKIPGLGRLFRASETAFNGGALRMRADLADWLISRMDAQGLNTLNPDVARGAGHLVGSLTGRGSLGRATTISKELNFVMWSARFLKANIDTLTAHQFDPKATKFTKTEARTNLALIVAHVAGLMMFAKWLDPESVDEDPRSTNFGRIKLFGHWTDVTGGMRTIAILGARLAPSFRDGQWGFWSKSSTGKWTNLTAGQYGQQDAVDVLMDTLFLNRLSPVGSIMRDMWRGEMFGGEPFDIKKSITNSGIPLSIQNVNDVKDEGFTAILGVAISEFFGLGVSTYKYSSNWSKRTSQTMKNFREQVGDDKFEEANNSYNRAYSEWKEQVAEDPRYKELSEKGKRDLDASARKALEEKILKEYGYQEPVEKPETVEEIREKEKIKQLKPISSLIEGVSDVLGNINLVPEVLAGEPGDAIEHLSLEGDRVEITYADGDYKNVDIDTFIDKNNFLGKLLNDIGTTLGLPELELSEKAGYLNREQKLEEFNKRLEAIYGVVEEEPPEEDLSENERIEKEIKRNTRNARRAAPEESKSGITKNMPDVERELRASGVYSPEVLAYAYATIQHETANKFEPVNEGWFNDEKFGYDPGFTGRSEARKRGYEGGEDFFGRGYIQLTHKANYKEFGKKIGVDLVKNPELANDPDNAAKILALYFEDRGVADLIEEGKITEARRKINPDNKGRMIKKTYDKYLKKLKEE